MPLPSQIYFISISHKKNYFLVLVPGRQQLYLADIYYFITYLCGIWKMSFNYSSFVSANELHKSLCGQKQDFCLLPVFSLDPFSELEQCKAQKLIFTFQLTVESVFGIIY